MHILFIISTIGIIISGLFFIYAMRSALPPKDLNC